MTDDLRPYRAIMDLPHHVSAKYPQMPRENRAAQFMPFAAMVGYDSAVAEAARLTQSRGELSEDEAAVLDAKLAQLRTALATEGAHLPQVTLTIFVPDAAKEGGSFEDVTLILRRLDMAAGLAYAADGRVFRLADVMDITLDE